MNQALSGGAVALVLAVLWLLRRPRPQLMRSADGASVAALNRAQMELVVQDAGREPGPDQGQAPQSELGPDSVPDAQGAPWPSLPSQLAPSAQPRSLRDVNARLAALKAGFAQGGQARRQAMETCLAWGHRAALPLLHLGLRDADPVVAGLAARGLDRFRGRSGPAPTAAQVARLPRNVARTR
jgi:hypothetical protein